MWRQRKLLRKQLERLAEQSRFAVDSELMGLSAAMCEVYKELRRSTLVHFMLYSVVVLEFLVGVLILVQ